MQDGATAPRTVDSALDEVGRWRAEIQQRNQQELLEVDQELESLRTAVANLQQQLETLARFREELTRRDDRVATQEVERIYAAVFSALGEQGEAVRQRAERVAEAEAARDAALAESLRSSDVAALLTEYEQFKRSVEPTLTALPESYRSVILQHHESVTRRLREHLAGAFGKPVAVAGEPLVVDVVFGVDPAEGTPEVLTCVVPVAEAVYGEWSTRGDDLQLAIAARVVQALYTGCAAAGLAVPQPAFGGHQGLLAIEIDVSAAGDGLVGQIESAFQATLAQASELRGASVELRARQVPFDYLMPPEADEDEAPVEEVVGA